MINGTWPNLSKQIHLKFLLLFGYKLYVIFGQPLIWCGIASENQHGIWWRVLEGYLPEILRGFNISSLFMYFLISYNLFNDFCGLQLNCDTNLKIIFISDYHNNSTTFIINLKPWYSLTINQVEWANYLFIISKTAGRAK